MTSRAGNPETKLDSPEEVGSLDKQREAFPVQTHADNALWRGVCIGLPIALAPWLLVAWLLA
jgi:hypothetical protein